ncbi:MAG: universal stress protein [Salinirussus sp.]
MVILVAVAHDRLQEAVIDVAVELGRGLDQSLRIVHLTGDHSASADDRDLQERLRERIADRHVAATVTIEHAGHHGLRTGARVGQELVDFAADVDVTHVVMGHSSKGLVETVSDGNTAFAVADGAAVPVTIVPDGVEDGTDDG